MSRKSARVWTLAVRLAVASLVWSAAAQAAGDEIGFDVQGHRGCRGLAPENTLPAFERAIELGVTTLELDIQVLQDGVMVVHHDRRLNPKLCVYDDGRKVQRLPLNELRLEELAGLDCGSRLARKFAQQVPAPGARIPRLEEVLELAVGAPYPVRLNIEVKQPIKQLPLPMDELAERLVALLERYGLSERASIQSKYPEVLTAIRGRAPEIERSLIVRRGTANRWVDNGTATMISRNHFRLRRQQIAKLQQKGARVIPYTVNKPKQIEKLIDWGVDGLITDYPDRVLAILHDHQP